MRRFRFIDQSRVVQRELFERIFQRFVLVTIDREQTRIDHRLHIAIPRERFGAATRGVRDRVAHFHLRGILKTRDQIAHFTNAKLIDGHLGGFAHARFFNERGGIGGHHADLLTFFERPIHDTHERDHAAIRIEIGVEDERTQWCILLSYWSWDRIDDRFEQVLDAGASLATGKDGIIGRKSERVLDLGAHALRISCWKVDLIDERDDLKVGIHRHHGVRDRLRFDALRGIDHEHRTFACCKRAGNFIGEVDMTRGIDQIKMIELTVFGTIIDTYRLALDRDAAFALDVHRIEQLLFHIARRDRFGKFENTVRERRFAMIDVGDDREIADILRVDGHGSFNPSLIRKRRVIHSSPSACLPVFNEARPPKALRDSIKHC